MEALASAVNFDSDSEKEDTKIHSEKEKARPPWKDETPAPSDVYHKPKATWAAKKDVGPAA
ncbi:hypothetical protein HK405_001683, partial [Cladochytrium tenue]